ncbi:WhiB family transcriptional regulator [Streptomyces noursei]|uniref:WhiB family transcriptional regulator n=1 Tax=Streptomyces noursei TaxID=1971 RepID=UPI000C9B7C3B
MRGAYAKSDLDLFFAVPRSVEHERALGICTYRLARTECLAQAFDGWVTHGIFGGATPAWRRKLLRRRPHVTSWCDHFVRARAECMSRPHRPPDTHRQRNRAAMKDMQEPQVWPVAP